jgi:membrane associated rhomboid family serine protease
MTSPPPLPRLRSWAACRRQTVYRSHPALPWPQSVLYLVGLPVEMSQSVVHRRPWAIHGLAILIASVSIAVWVSGQQATWWRPLALQPSTTGGAYWLGLLGHGLVHLDWLHLLGNLYFLIVFGDNIECQFGRRRVLGLFFISAMAGGWLHGHFVGNPLIGASGGVLGLVLFYALQFPRARILWLPFGFLFRLVLWVGARPLLRYGLPMWAYVALCVGIDLLVLQEQLAGESLVSALAHLGGGAAGVAIWILWRRGWLP